MIRGLRWLLLDGPCRFYLAGERNGGAISWTHLVGAAAGVLGFGGIGAVLALLFDADPLDWFVVGSISALAALVVWMAYTLVVMGVLWALGRPPDEVVARSTPGQGGDTDDDAIAWRRRGEPLIPGSLVAILCLLVVLGLFEGWSAHTAGDERGWKAFTWALASLTALSGLGYVRGRWKARRRMRSPGQRHETRPM